MLHMKHLSKMGQHSVKRPFHFSGGKQQKLLSPAVLPHLANRDNMNGCEERASEKLLIIKYDSEHTSIQPTRVKSIINVLNYFIP